jgi:hypothetical protein
MRHSALLFDGRHPHIGINRPSFKDWPEMPPLREPRRLYLTELILRATCGPDLHVRRSPTSHRTGLGRASLSNEGARLCYSWTRNLSESAPIEARSARPSQIYIPSLCESANSSDNFVAISAERKKDPP